MHCISCEMILENELEKIDWLKIDSVSHKTWKIVLDYEDENIIKEVKKVLFKNKYSLEDSKEWLKNYFENKNTFLDYIIIFLLFILFWLLYLLLKDSWLDKYLPTAWSDVSIFTAFFVWIWASLSTCLAMLWWIVVWISTEQDWNLKNFWDKLKLQLSFHFWRILSFVILWWILWEIWGFLLFSTKINWIIAIFVALIILYVWLHMINLVPSISKLWIHFPKFITKNLNNNREFWPFIIWLLTFFIPCWFTQAMQLASVASWWFLNWAMIMWFFALWTMPVLLLLWIMSSYSKNKNYSVLKKVIWVFVIMFSLIWISNSSNLIFSWNPTKIKIEDSSTGSTNSVSNDRIEEISITHDWIKTEPYQIKLKSNQKYKLSIIPKSNWVWCLTTITIPWVDESVQRVIKWEEIIFNIPALSPWTYKLVCTAMGMSQGELVVE